MNEQKGFVQFIVLGIAVLAIIATGLFYLGRQSLPKPAPSENQTAATSLITPSPNTRRYSQLLSVTLSVVQLRTSFGINGQGVSYPQDITVSVPSMYTEQVGAYGVSGRVVIGPTNWTGEGSVGADGSNVSYLYPVGSSVHYSDDGSAIVQGAHINVDEVPGCVVCGFGAASPYFPEATEWLKKQNSYIPPPRTGLIINKITPNLIRYQLPNTPDGLEVNGVAYFKVSGNTQPYFIEMELTLPLAQHDFAVMLLNTFIERQKLLTVSPN